MRKPIIILLVVILIPFAIYLLCWRTPSIKRLEKVTRIDIPEGFEVLKDSFKEKVPHYVLDYDIKLSSSKVQAFKSYLDKSTIWHKSKIGYEFNITDKYNTVVLGTFDTTTNILSYHEYSD